MTKRITPPVPVTPETPAPILFGTYTAHPEGKVWSDGACRWRVKGPGVSRLTRLLRRDQALDEVWAWLESSGMAGVRPVMWAEVVPQAPVSRHREYRQIGAGEPLPAWVVLDEERPKGVCLVAVCEGKVVSRGLCANHDSKARVQGIRDRIGPKATRKGS